MVDEMDHNRDQITELGILRFTFSWIFLSEGMCESYFCMAIASHNGRLNWECFFDQCIFVEKQKETEHLLDPLFIEFTHHLMSLNQKARE